LPEAHFLESWGDARAWDGTYSVVQPLIEPLYDGRSAIELVASLAGQAADRADALVRQTCYEILGRPMPETPTEAEQEPDEGEAGEGAPAEAMAAGVLPADAGVEIPASPAFAAWRKVVVEGVLAGSAWPKQTPKVTADKADDVAKADEEKPADDESESDELEIVFTADASVYDGRFANSGWLQEMPDPMTRLTWDNAALLAPATAKRLGVSDGDLLRLKLGQRELTVPAYVLPGQAPNSVAVALGYGRTAAGHVGGSQSLGVEPVGANAYALRTTGAMHFGTGLEIEPTGETYPLASVQNHHAIDTVGQEGIAKRLGQLVREATLAYYVEHPEFAKHKVHHPPLESLWDEPSFDGRRWGMSIDLSKCIGCGACVVACQAENNIPIVGKQRVSEGREMHWLRIDRYFRGPAEEPQVAHQPVACQQCELAPCEQVCPVAATVHSKEGLNDMVYNRCVGTRYCANNCPYKVRRFNYFNYHTELKRAENEPVKMVYNPEVTIRSRGVMEKCTYCVQRIQNVKIDAKNQRRPIADGEIKTACQQACPAQAIEFGDLSDPKSNVRAAHEADRAYAVLEELNVKPRTRYLAKIRNPNPELQEPEHEHDSGHA
jgi:molybdopterin-containing oxidoreductase family iron-sulfur binding subunit